MTRTLKTKTMASTDDLWLTLRAVAEHPQVARIADVAYSMDDRTANDRLALDFLYDLSNAFASAFTTDALDPDLLEERSFLLLMAEEIMTGQASRQNAALARFKVWRHKREEASHARVALWHAMRAEADARKQDISGAA